MLGVTQAGMRSRKPPRVSLSKEVVMILTLNPILARIQAHISGQRCGACLHLDEANVCRLKQRSVSPDTDSCPDWKLDRVLAATAKTPT
jgi:hypothetical protein